TPDQAPVVQPPTGTDRSRIYTNSQPAPAPQRPVPPERVAPPVTPPEQPPTSTGRDKGYAPPTPPNQRPKVREQSPGKRQGPPPPPAEKDKGPDKDKEHPRPQE